jgi:hypothetical protein
MDYPWSLAQLAQFDLELGGQFVAAGMCDQQVTGLGLVEFGM